MKEFLAKVRRCFRNSDTWSMLFKFSFWIFVALMTLCCIIAFLIYLKVLIPIAILLLISLVMGFMCVLFAIWYDV